MKRMFIATGAIIALTGMGILSWIMINNVPEDPPKLADVATIEQLNNAITPAAGTAQEQQQAPKSTARVQPVVKAPETVQQIQKTLPGNAAPPTAAPAAPSVKEPVELTIAEMTEIRTQVKASLENDFKDKASFQLNENKMITFIQAGNRVKRINDKWDVQIAGAETDSMAIEYSNFAVEEITKAMQKITGLSLDEYNEMSKLTATNQNFNQIYQVYKKLMQEGIVQPAPVPVNPQPASVTPSTVSPSAPAEPVPGIKVPVKNIPSPAAAPVNPGTAQVPQGSPAPQYSQPSSR